MWAHLYVALMWAHGCTVVKWLRALHQHKGGVCAYVRNNRGVGTPVVAAVAGSTRTINVNAFVQLSLTSSHFLLNKQNCFISYQGICVAYTQFLFVVEKNTRSHFLFDIMSGTFISGKISTEKKVMVHYRT